MESIQIQYLGESVDLTKNQSVEILDVTLNQDLDADKFDPTKTLFLKNKLTTTTI